MANRTIVRTSNAGILSITDISDRTMTIFIWVAIAGLCQTIDVFGVITNIINILCFAKQGFKEPVNISLCGLAISDLGCLVTQMCMNLFFTLEASTSDLTFDPIEVAYLAIAMPHMALSRVNIWITVIITLERCLCITVPLKVKSIVTAKRVLILISCVYVIFIFSGGPVFAVNKLDMTFSTSRNKTLLGLVSTEDRDKVEGITFTVNNFLLTFIAFIIIIICTIILVVNLRKRQTLFSTSSTTSQAGISSRDQKVAKMVVMISVLFIICFIPLAIVMFSLIFEPNLNIGGKLANIGKMLGNIALLTESINSAANIFIYYYMSKKYRDTFHGIFFFYKDIDKS